jgi:hypothetical protein
MIILCVFRPIEVHCYDFLIPQYFPPIPKLNVGDPSPIDAIRVQEKLEPDQEPKKLAEDPKKLTEEPKIVEPKKSVEQPKKLTEEPKSDEAKKLEESKALSDTQKVGS